jgi:hypothetical protein
LKIIYWKISHIYIQKSVQGDEFLGIKFLGTASIQREMQKRTIALLDPYAPSAIIITLSKAGTRHVSCGTKFKEASTLWS